MMHHTKMAAIESLKFSFPHILSSPNPPLLFPTKFKIPTSISNSVSTPNVSLKSQLYPIPLPISRSLQVCSSSSSSAIQEDVSVQEQPEEENLEQTQKEDRRKKLFVLNLPWSYTVSDIKNVFGECGTVADVEIIKQKNGKSRGFAFVTMSSGEEAQAAIDKFDSHELLGRIIKVEFAKRYKKPSPSPPGILPPSETRYKLFVSNLAWKVRASHLREFFSTEFNPVSARVVFDGPSGKSTGFGFVSFASKEEAESAISALNGKDLLGRQVALKFSEPVTDKSEKKEENTAQEEPAES